MREALHRIRLRLLALVHRRRLDRDLEDEISFHLAMRAEQYGTDGVAPKSAQAAAERRFGNVLGLKEACRQLWSLNLVEDVVQDLRFGARMLRRSPGFTAVVVATLTLGIGASTAILAFLDLRPLPVSQPEQLVMLHWATEAAKGWDASGDFAGCEKPHVARFEDCNVPYPIYGHVSDRARTFAGIAAFSNPTEAQVRLRGEAALAKVQFTSGNYFSVLGVGAGLGRTLNASDDREGVEPVAVLSHGYWRERFGSDPSAVGGVVSINGTVVTLVGVAAPSCRRRSKRPSPWGRRPPSR